MFPEIEKNQIKSSKCTKTCITFLPTYIVIPSTKNDAWIHLKLPANVKQT